MKPDMPSPLSDAQLQDCAALADGLDSEGLPFVAGAIRALLAEVERLRTREAELTALLNSANRDLMGGIERYLKGLGEDLAAKMGGA